jgi:hypothetical protein
MREPLSNGALNLYNPLQLNFAARRVELGEGSMNEIMEYLEATAKHVSKELVEIYSRTDQEHGLVFPRKRDGSVRISEQEAKTLFLYRVLSERRFCLSVEVPTE